MRVTHRLLHKVAFALLGVALLLGSVADGKRAGARAYRRLDGACSSR